MIGVEITGKIIDTCNRIIKYAPKMQQGARKNLVKELHSICNRCEEAYSLFLQRLEPIKASYNNKRKIARELRSFAADGDTRARSKPEHICGQVDHIFSTLSDNLSSLKYSVNVFRIGTLRELLSRLRFSDATLRHEYDEFASELDSLATLINSSKPQDSELWRQYAADLISSTETKMNDAVMRVRVLKDEIVDRVL